ncbi:MAG: dipeptidase [Pyramidobacter sp.]|jgi:dipeptidase
MSKAHFFGTLILAIGLFCETALGCTVFGVGKNASATGHAMISHSCDSMSDTFQLHLVPGASHEAGAERFLLKEGKGCDEGDDPGVIGKIPEVPQTNQYLTSRYAFLNDKGLAMGESTMTMTADDKRSEKVLEVMETNAFGMTNCHIVQDIALERARTAREAVKVIGDLINEYGWYEAGETMPITDGNEVWIVEAYGNKMWAAWRVPNDEIFVAANRARLRELDLTDTENVAYAPGMVEYAVEQGFIDAKDVNMKNFSPADVFYPTLRLYSALREWRALTLFAPSVKLDPYAHYFPKSIKPDKPVSVADLFRIYGDWYEGTEFDLSKGPAAGPYGNPNRYRKEIKLGWNDNEFPRAINDYRHTYVQICEVDPSLPEAVRGIVWFGYGAADTTYLTPFWASMKRLPEAFTTGTRKGPFDPKSAWWECIRVQHIAELRYQDIRKEIIDYRTPLMEKDYVKAHEIQKQAAELIAAGQDDKAIELITDYACSNAETWHKGWNELGNRLFAKYCLNGTSMQYKTFPEEWSHLIWKGPFVRPDGTK